MRDRNGSGAPKMVRISPPLLSRIEKYRAKMQKASPGTNVTLSDVLRTLIHAGLDAAEI